MLFIFINACNFRSNVNVKSFSLVNNANFKKIIIGKANYCFFTIVLDVTSDLQRNIPITITTTFVDCSPKYRILNFILRKSARLITCQSFPNYSSSISVPRFILHLSRTSRLGSKKVVPKFCNYTCT